MTDNHMVFFAEIAFIYGGNDSSEKDVFGSERSSEKLWFDVGIKRYTTQLNLLIALAGLWLDVGIKIYTTDTKKVPEKPPEQFKGLDVLKTP